MRTSSPAIFIAAFGLFGLSALSARSAFADSTCATDADCVKGWACQVTSSGGCGYACASGQDCPPPPDCTPPTDLKSCVPGPCKADSDCAAGMVCYSSSVTNCGPGPSSCAPGASCPAGPCTTTTQSACIPRYDAPCKADADCGAGFSCLPDSTNCGCASAGSAPSGSGSADGGAPTPDPIPPTPCECPAATTSSCHALPVTCKSAADCASGWTCEAIVSPRTCTMGAPAEPPTPAPGANGSADGGASIPAQDAGASDPCPPTQPAMFMCVPPYYSLGGGTLGSSETGGSAIGTSGTAGGSAAGVPKAPGAANDSNGSSTSTAGCSVSRGTSGGASGLALLALGLFGFARRRRTERAARSAR